MLEYNDLFKEIHQEILLAKNILIITHKNPDGDCLGAGCGFGNYLSQINKSHTLFNIDKVSPAFEYLDGVEKFIDDQERIKRNFYDIIIILDTGSLDYSGVEEIILEKRNQDHTKIINIDHHFSNTQYGDINLVVPHASSASEIVYQFFKQNKIVIDKTMANCVLSGIVTDSGNFSNGATTISSIEAASYLLVKGGHLPKILKHNYQNKSVQSLRLWGQVLARLEKNEKYNITYTYITLEDMKKFSADENDIAGIIDFMNNLKDSKIMMIIKEKEDNKISVSMRTTRDDVDVSRLAKTFGGGGHKKAAGFTVDGRIVEREGKICIQ